MIWANFGKNRMNRLGQVKKSSNLKIAKKLNLVIFLILDFIRLGMSQGFKVKK